MPNDDLTAAADSTNKPNPGEARFIELFGGGSKLTIESLDDPQAATGQKKADIMPIGRLRSALASKSGVAVVFR